MRTHQNRLLLLLALIGLLQIATLRPGHSWGDDFAHYIMQAKHMAAGDGFVAREYVPNPEVLNIGPQTVPPGLSVLLLTVYAVAGLNITAMKILLIFCVLVVLFLADRLFEERLPPAWRLALVALIGLNPVLFDMRDMIETEKPFLVFELLALYLMQRAYRREGKPPLWMAIALGLTMFAACATRNVGVALFPALAMTTLLAFRRLVVFAIVSGGIAGAGTLAVFRMMQTASGYGGYFNFSPSWLVHSALVMSKTSEYFWWNSTPRMVAYVALAVAGAFALWGLWLSLRRGPGPVEFFLVFYLPIIWSYFAPEYIYYLLPAYPFYMGYLLMGVRNLGDRMPAPKPVIAAAAALACALYVVDFTRFNWGPIREGIGDPEFVQLTAYIRSHTGKSDLLLFRKPRLLALMTERPSSSFPVHLDRPTKPEEVWAYIEKSKAHYLITSSALTDPDAAQTSAALEQFSNSYARDLKLVYSSPHYQLYRIDN